MPVEPLPEYNLSMPKTPDYQRHAADRWRVKQKDHGAHRVEFLLTAGELQALDALAEHHGSRIATLRWLLQNALPAEAKPVERGAELLPILFDTSAAAKPERIQALVAEIQRLQSEGLTQEAIARRWNEAGIPTLRWQARGWTWKNISNLITRHGKG